MVENIDELPILEVYAALTQSGFPQSEFCKSFGLSSRDGSRKLKKLLLAGKITRTSLVHANRNTFLIKATNDLTIQELKAILQPSKKLN